MEHVDKGFLLGALRQHLRVDQKYTDDLLTLNLFNFFIQDETATIRWVAFLEKKYHISIPDNEVDIFFFSDLDHMTATVQKALHSNENELL
jgi:hypothetical protein